MSLRRAARPRFVHRWLLALCLMLAGAAASWPAAAEAPPGSRNFSPPTYVPNYFSNESPASRGVAAQPAPAPALAAPALASPRIAAPSPVAMAPRPRLAAPRQPSRTITAAARDSGHHAVRHASHTTRHDSRSTRQAERRAAPPHRVVGLLRTAHLDRKAKTREAGRDRRAAVSSVHKASGRTAASASTPRRAASPTKAKHARAHG